MPFKLNVMMHGHVNVMIHGHMNVKSWVPAIEKVQGCDVRWESDGQPHFGTIMVYYGQTSWSMVQQSV
jgi:D-aminopeptidase